MSSWVERRTERRAFTYRVQAVLRTTAFVRRVGLAEGVRGRLISEPRARGSMLLGSRRTPAGYSIHPRSMPRGLSRRPQCRMPAATHQTPELSLGLGAKAGARAQAWGLLANRSRGASLQAVRTNSDRRRIAWVMGPREVRTRWRTRCPVLS